MESCFSDFKSESNYLGILNPDEREEEIIFEIVEIECSVET